MSETMTTTATRIDERVTCPRCRERLAAEPNAAARFAVGNPARPDMGHALFFSATGRVALCAAAAR